MDLPQYIPGGQGTAKRVDNGQKLPAGHIDAPSVIAPGIPAAASSASDRVAAVEGAVVVDPEMQKYPASHSSGVVVPARGHACPE